MGRFSSRVTARQAAPGVVAIVLATLLTVSASVPANAAELDAAAVAPFDSARGWSTAGPPQSLAASTAVTANFVRDGFTVVKAPPKPVAKPVAKPAAAAAAVAPPRASVQWPFPAAVRISGGFGPRIPPCAGCSSFHKGLDLTPGAGTPVNAVANGVVRSASAYDNGGLGVHVVIDHRVDGRLVSSVYAHFASGSLAVGVGQPVVAGQRIGNVGSTGQSTGPHLHLEILLDGVTPTDPYAWLSNRAGAR